MMEAACPTSSFEVPGSVCLEETIVFTNNSVNSVNYSWDFCVGDLGETPTAENILTDASLGLASQLAVLKMEGIFTDSRLIEVLESYFGGTMGLLWTKPHLR